MYGILWFFINYFRKEYFPEALEDEEGNENARLNADGHYEMSNVYETTFDLKVVLDYDNIHKNELPGVIPFSIDMSGQDNQTILGIREGSVMAFWNIGGTKRPVQRPTGVDLPEFVNIRALNSSLLQIELCFQINSEAADKFEFGFKVKLFLQFYTQKLWVLNLP